MELDWLVDHEKKLFVNHVLICVPLSMFSVCVFMCLLGIVCHMVICACLYMIVEQAWDRFPTGAFASVIVFWHVVCVFVFRALFALVLFFVFCLCPVRVGGTRLGFSPERASDRPRGGG